MPSKSISSWYFNYLVFLSLSLMQLIGSLAIASDITIAVASNFSAPMKKLIVEYEKKSGHRIRAAYGSSGKLFNQIQNGAPFSALFSADQMYLNRLTEQDKLDTKSRFTYAVGSLVLWSSKTDFINKSAESFKKGQFNYLAIANPKSAPYGKAAMEVIEVLGLSEVSKGKLVVGENIMQAFQYVSSGNADLGLIALSQVVLRESSSSGAFTGSSWRVPRELYKPIVQDAAILSDAKDNKVLQDFFDYMQSHSARTLIASFGYLAHEDN